MDREEFQSSRIVVVGVVGLLYILFGTAYFQTDMPLWVLLVIVIMGVLVLTAVIKTKIIIERGVLRYKKIGSGEEVPLQQVAQISVREVETIVQTNQANTAPTKRKGISIGSTAQTTHERKVEKIMYVLDQSGRTYFTFPAHLIQNKERERFKAAVKAVNEKIDIF